jgi:hypothetical protein
LFVQPDMMQYPLLHPGGEELKPVKFKIVELDETLVSHTGLAAVGSLLNSTRIAQRSDALELPGKPRPAIKHSDCLRSMIGLLCLGKSDFNDIIPFLDDPFFAQSLGLGDVPSEPTLRQRMAEFGPLPQEILRQESALMVRRHAPKISPCFKEWVALDIDVSPFDNSNTQKEGCSYTYKKHDGFAPIFAYLGEEGYLALEEFREGSQHCQKGTPEFLERAIAAARVMTDAKLLARLDSGNDAEETLETLRKRDADFIIKRNLRNESLKEWLTEAQALGKWQPLREGKTLYVGETSRQCGERSWRVVFEVIEKTINSDGQQLMFPEIEVATYWTSLGPRQATPDEVIQIYHSHGTSEQFHSELKTDLDLERLPSGHFAVNSLILTCGMVAYNILRLMGQMSLSEDKKLPPDEKMPLAKKVKRRRLRSVIQDLMYFASRLIRHGRRFILGIARSNPWRRAWEKVYERTYRPRPCRT